MENKDGILQEVLCMACLCFGRNLRVIRDTKMKQYYLDTLNEIPLCNTSLTSPVVCWECEALLKRIIAFREQVQDSYRILQTYTNENLHECLLTDVTRPPRLKVVTYDPIVINPDVEEKGDVQLVCLKDEVKQDWDERDSPEPSNAGYPSEVSDMDELEAELQAIINDKKKKKNPSKVKRTRGTNSVENKQRVEDALVHGGGTLKTIEIEIMTAEHEGNPEVICLKDEVQNDWDKRDSQEPISAEYTKDDGNNMDEEIQAIIGEKKRKNTVHSKLKRTKKIVKTLERNKKARGSQGGGGSERQYRTVELTHEQLQAERRRAAARDAYVRAPYKCAACLVPFHYRRAYDAHVSARHGANIGKYICPICKTIIASVESFTSHYKRHMRRFECTLCNKRAIDRGRIKQHLYTAHNIALSTIKCKQCGHTSLSLDSHIHHLDTHKGRFKCPDCVKTFKHRGGLKNHIIAVHELNNNFPCSVCGKVFRWKNSLKRHLEKHDTKEKTEAAYCESCGISFKSNCSYQRHLKNSLKHVSQDQRKYVCDHCNRRFIDKTKLRDHIEDKHLHRTYQCPVCLKSSKNRVNLDQHIRNVHKGRPNNKMCHHCGKGFPTKVQLESHMRTHTGERPFICEYCPTTFTQKSNLYKHYRQVHLNIKSKRYPLCKKRKDEKSEEPQQSIVDPYKPTKVQLESHMRTHTGERPFICEYCPTTFTQKSNLYKHYRQVHLNIKSKRYPLCKKRKDEKSEEPQQSIVDPYKPVAVLRFSPGEGFRYVN